MAHTRRAVGGRERWEGGYAAEERDDSVGDDRTLEDEACMRAMSSCCLTLPFPHPVVSGVTSSED